MSNPTSNFGWQMPTNSDLVTDLPADFEVFGQGVDTTLADLKGGTSGQILSKNTNADMDFVWINNDQGDITGVTATSPLTGGGTSGAITVGIQAASTTQSGAVQLTDSTSSTSTSTAATPNSVKSAYDLANTANTTANTANSTANAAIPKSTVTAKGSIVAASASSTPAQLAVGNNGETLVADSSTTTGLRYTAGTVQANPVLNSAMQIWQRGTSIALSASTAYTADRWQGRTGTGAQTISRQVTNDTTNLPSIQYCARVGRNSGNTGTGIILFEQSMETINTIPFVGKTVTLSLYARKGANFSATSDLMYAAVVTGTGTDQNVSGYTGGANTILGSATLTTTWQRFTFTGTIPTTVTEMGVQLSYTPTGTAGAADYLEVTGVQIDIGSVALPFRTYAGTIQGELAACQRYFQTIQGNATASTAGVSFAYASSTTNGVAYFYPRASFRVVPSVAQSSLYLSDIIANNYTVTGLSVNSSASTVDMIRLDAAVASGLTAKNWYSLQGNATTSYVQLSAEL